MPQQSIYTFLHRGARGQHRRYELLLPDELEDELEDEPLPLERPRPLDELLECSLSGWLGWWPARCATSRSELDSGMLAATAPAPRAAGRGRRGCRAGATGARRRTGRCPWLPRSAAAAAVWSNSTSVLTSAGSGGAGRDSSWARSTSIGGTLSISMVLAVFVGRAPLAPWGSQAPKVKVTQRSLTVSL